MGTAALPRLLRLASPGIVAGAALVLLGGEVRAAGIHPVVGRHGMVVASEPRAVDVGVEVLAAGGNAFDAAVAVGFALAVTHPLAGNLGGGGFAVATTASGEAWALDFRETAPAAAHRDLFLDEAGEVLPDASTRSHRAVGVPGSVDGLLLLLERGGTMDRAALLAPAIALARDGFPVTDFLHDAIAEGRDLLAPHESSSARYLPDDEPLAPGARLAQPDLAATLEAIAADGRDGFYDGLVAALLVAEMERHGGLITRDDLRAYRAVWREPLLVRDGPRELVFHPLPSSGGIVIAQVLGVVDDAALVADGWHSAGYVRRLVEAERLAYADRNRWLGDPGFVDVPVAALLSPEYLARRRASLPAAGAGSSAAVGAGDPFRGDAAGGAAGGERAETTHYCVVDAAGNAVAVTTTLNGWWGMGAVVPGAGFLLNNEMDDFSAKPGVPNLYGLVGAEANAIAPGKRMLSSMSPLIVREDGRFAMTIGTPGGSTIITTVLQIYLDATRFGMNVREAVDAPRFHHQWLPDVVYVERFALSPDTRARLADLGYVLEEREPIGRAAAIFRGADGRLEGWADRRGIGKAAGPDDAPAAAAGAATGRSSGEASGSAGGPASR